MLWVEVGRAILPADPHSCGSCRLKSAAAAPVNIPSTATAAIPIDANRVLTRVVSAVSALQLVIRTSKAQAGAKAIRIGLLVPKSK